MNGWVQAIEVLYKWVSSPHLKGKVQRGLKFELEII